MQRCAQVQSHIQVLKGTGGAPKEQRLGVGIGSERGTQWRGEVDGSWASVRLAAG